MNTSLNPPSPEAWRPFTPQEVALRLAGAGFPWGVVGGWGIDLWLGEQTREHHDIEIAIPRSCFPLVPPFFPDLTFFAVGSGEVAHLPDGEVHPPEKHQTWLLDERSAEWRLDVMLEPGDAEEWVFRRDERISRPRRQMIARRDGIPFLRPEGILLYKAKHCREKDLADFERVLPTMEADARGWLIASLQSLHPSHDWLSPLLSFPEV